MKNITRMTTSQLIIGTMTGTYTMAQVKAELLRRKVWKLSAAEKAKLDHDAIHAMRKLYNFEIGASKRPEFSGLTFKQAPKAERTEESKRAYSAAVKALHIMRGAFSPPKPHAQASMTDRKQREAKRLAKFSPEQVRLIVALAEKYRKQAAQ
jgi:hypothetical protein